MHPVEIKKEFKTLTMDSRVFKNGGSIPSKYTCDGANINPPLEIGHIPEDVKCLVLIVEDPDAPQGTWLHWLVWDIPVKYRIKENEIPGVEGMNDFGRTSYGGPCPPSGLHHYHFKVYGLADLVQLPTGASRGELEQAMRDRILAYGELIGVYKKIGKNVK